VHECLERFPCHYFMIRLVRSTLNAESGQSHQA
jgi:hypothetical protein